MDLRFGTSENIDVIIRYIIEAGAGTYEFLLDGLIPTVDACDLLRYSVTDASSPYHFSNAVLAEDDGATLGMVLALPSEDLGMSEIVARMLPQGRQHALSELTGSIGPGSWYVNTLVVEEAAQSLGVGRALLTFSADVARQLGRDAMTLHVWSDNERAFNLYRSVGFREVDRFKLDLSERGYKCADMAVMSAKLPLLAT
jgi:ribosomal protein S18 acetylase RimI-like enzyme